MTTQVAETRTVQTDTLQPTSGNRNAALSQSSRGWILSAAALVLLVASAAGIALAAATNKPALVTPSAAAISQPATANTASVLFGCSGQMVIANLDCDLGAANAFDAVQPVVYQPHQNQPLIHIPDREQAADLAPWCNGRPDQTIYGCPTTSQDPAAALVLEDATQALTHQCANEVWIGDILFRIEAGRTRAQTCLAQVKPLPACIP